MAKEATNPAGMRARGTHSCTNFLKVSLTKKERPIMIWIKRENIKYDKDEEATRSNTPHIDTQVS